MIGGAVVERESGAEMELDVKRHHRRQVLKLIFLLTVRCAESRQKVLFIEKSVYFWEG